MIGSTAFQSYVRNIQRIVLAETLDNELLKGYRWQLSIAGAPVRVPITAPRPARAPREI